MDSRPLLYCGQLGEQPSSTAPRKYSSFKPRPVVERGQRGAIELWWSIFLRKQSLKGRPVLPAEMAPPAVRHVDPTPLFLALALVTLLTATSLAKDCRAFPGDTAWPPAFALDTLKSSVGGRLDDVIPPAAVCHNNCEGKATYNSSACSSIGSA